MNNALNRGLLYVLWIALYILHNDIWLWHDAGFALGLPVGLLYHVGFCFAAAVMLGLLVLYARPPHMIDVDEAESADEAAP